jgi:DNA-binding transcriptional LysR family regulator
LFTFKQLEALYWVAKLGGFSPAANRLHTTQSAVSKRIQELEALVGTPLFDRSQRSARLLAKGQEMLLIAQRMLQQRDAAIEQIVRPEVQERHMRIGVTEVTAMTWLPRFVNLLTAHYPRLRVEPNVESGAILRDKLHAGELDLMIAADTIKDQRFTSIPIGKLHLEWMCKPGTVRGGKRPMKVQELANYTILRQQEKSANGKLFDDWFRAHGLKPAQVLVSNSLVALIGLTVAGAGISYLPGSCLRAMLDAGLLAPVQVVPLMPTPVYLATYRSDQDSSFMSVIIKLAQETCDFTQIFQT